MPLTAIAMHLDVGDKDGFNVGGNVGSNVVGNNVGVTEG